MCEAGTGEQPWRWPKDGDQGSRRPVRILHRKRFAWPLVRSKFVGMPHAPAKPKRGRPRAEATMRISPRFPVSTAGLLERASALRGLTVTGFVLESAREAAERVIAEESRWRLDEAETRKMLRLLSRPPRPNAAARRAQALSADVEIRS